MLKITQPAFAAAYMDGKKPHIMSWTVSGNAGTVRRTVGKSWHKDDPAIGWKAARKEGVKVIKIALVADLQ
jgi:hypothetical protein